MVTEGFHLTVVAACSMLAPVSRSDATSIAWKRAVTYPQ
jgi:hypothetical protein